MDRYKTLFCIFVCMLVMGTYGLDEEMAELARMLREECADETGVDLSLVDKVNDGADLMPDPKLKCYMKCVMEMAGMMDGGDVDVEATIAMLPDDIQAKTAHILRSCGTKKGSDDCETAYLTQVCWQTNGKADYFLV